LSHSLQANLELRGALQLLGPDDAKLHFALAIKDCDLIQQIEFAPDRAQAHARRGHVQRMRQFVEILPGTVAAFHSDGDYRFSAISPALVRFPTRRSHHSPKASLAEEPAIENGSDEWERGTTVISRAISRGISQLRERTFPFSLWSNETGQV